MYLRKGHGRQPRRGNILVISCLILTGILFLCALAIDGVNEMARRRQAQECCDAAALSGCIKLADLKAQSATPSLQNLKDAVNLSAGNNGYTSGTNCTVTVNWPPTSGNFQDANSVEVLLTFTYTNLVVSGSNSVTVRAVASCNTGGTPSFPMLLTEPTAAKAFWVNSGNLTMAVAPVVVDSSSSTAAVVDGSPSSAAAATVRTVGDSSGSFTPSTKTGVAPLNNPYALVEPPSTSGLTTYTQSVWPPNSSGNVVLNPGYYPNGLYVINGGNVTMNPGVYYVTNGNFWINTGGTVTTNTAGYDATTGHGVLIYHNGSDSSAELSESFGLNVGICLCPTNGDYTFSPPTTGPYAGMSFFHNPSYTGEAFYDFWGTANLNTGIQYFNGGKLRCWSGTHGGTINCNELVANSFKLTGTHEIYGTSQNGGFSKLTWNSTRAANRPPTNVYLAE